MLSKISTELTKSSAINQAKIDAEIIDPIEAQKFIKFCDEYSKQLKADIFNRTYDEVSALHKDERNFNGTKISIVERKATYDYSACDDWVQLELEIKRLTEQKKEREKMISSAIKSDSTILCEFTGELLTKDSFKIKSNASCYFKVELPK